MSIFKDILTGTEKDFRILMNGSNFLPEVQALRGLGQNHYHEEDVFEHTMMVFGLVDPNPILRLAALLHDTGKFPTRVPKDDGTATFYGHEYASARIAEAFLETVACFTGEEKEEVIWLVANHMKISQFVHGTSRKKQAKVLRDPRAMNLIDLYIADCLGRTPQARDKLNSALDIICEFYERERTLEQLGVTHENPIKVQLMNNILTKRPNTTKDELLAAVGA